ncbi:MAG: large conductance mechanosensitive channel protein MscL [bacterium]|nr:large conductance mechanosensitive channel protein MscL [bacterium]
MISEFKKFISKGNVVDLAVGVVIGGAFSKIVSSLVNDIIMPIIGILIGGIDFSSISFKVSNATINIGLFIQNIVDFLIIAFCIFIVIRFINKIDELTIKKIKKENNNEKEKDIKKENVSEEILLLRSINENLKKANSKSKKKS